MAYEIFNGDKLPYRGTERFRKLDNPIDSLRFEARYRHGIEPISPEEVALLPSLVVERGCEGAAHYIHGGMLFWSNIQPLNGLWSRLKARLQR